MERKAVYCSEISAIINITADEVKYLLTACEHHYDYKVKEAARPGGFMWGHRNYVFEWKPGKPVRASLTFNQIELLYKAVEFDSSNIAHDMKKIFWETLMRMNERQKNVNEALNRVLNK